jgi:hypothetical protein
MKRCCLPRKITAKKALNLLNVLTASLELIPKELSSRIFPLLIMRIEKERNPTFWTEKRLKILTHSVLSLRGYPYLTLNGETYHSLREMGFSRKRSEGNFLRKVVFPSKEVQEFLTVMDQEKQNPLKRKSPTIRFVGVGYKDQGSMRSLSFDGSPHWKEVSGRIPDTPNADMETPTNIRLRTRVMFRR